jgi:hypothetical protein
MDHRAEEPKRHLTPDQVEAFALDHPARLRGADAHLAACTDCRSEVESLRVLAAALAGLGVLDPGSRFAEQVMARVSLPVPLYLRAWAVTRERWITLAAASIAVVAAASVMVLWLANQPEMSVAGLFGLMIQQARDFSLQVVMTIGGALWSSSLIRAVVDGVGRIGMEGAILLASALSLVTISAAGAMLRLMQPAPLRLRRAA